MSKYRRRIEPTFSSTSKVEEDSSPAISNKEPDSEDRPHPSLKLAALAIVVACAVYIGDSALDSYREYQAMQFLNAQTKKFQNEMESAQRIARARLQQQRQARADTRTGKWLSKNCADWRRSHSVNPLPTSAAEMKRHCAAYERYLDTGIAPVGLR